MMIWWR